MLLRIALIALTLFLSACASKPGVSESDQQDWLDLANDVRQIKTWELEGKIGARQGNDATSFNIKWHQQGDAFNIKMFGPLGQGAVSLYGDDQGAVLRQGEQTIYSDSLQQLALENSDIALPLNQMKYWVRGLPSPETKAGIKVTHDGLLSQIRQDGWIIEYSEYFFDTQPVMPRKFAMKQQDSDTDASAKVIIKQWLLQN